MNTKTISLALCSLILSDKEEQFLKQNDFSVQDIASLTEEDVDPETVDFIKNGIGYFIISSILNMDKQGSDFDIADVRDAC